MNEIIIKALEGIGVPIYYGVRGKGTIPCIVFNHISTPIASSDDCEELQELKVLLSLYDRGDFSEMLKNVKSKMVQAGFVTKITPTGFYNSDLECWVAPIEFIKIIESE